MRVKIFSQSVSLLFHWAQFVKSDYLERQWNLDLMPYKHTTIVSTPFHREIHVVCLQGGFSDICETLNELQNNPWNIYSFDKFLLQNVSSKMFQNAGGWKYPVAPQWSQINPSW